MKVIDVPVYNDDGSVQFTQLVSPEEAKHLLQFAVNFLVSVGMSTQMLIAKDNGEDPDNETEAIKYDA